MTATLDAPAPEQPLLGRTMPRLWTRPLVDGPPGPCGCGCALTPETSLGFEAVRFVEDLPLMDAETGEPLRLHPWQRWWLIHAFELRAPGRLRFRTLVTLIARQNGKTTLLKVVALWLMYMGHARLVLGAAQSLDIARESWQGAVALVQANDALAAELEAVRKANGEQTLSLTSGARYKITAATPEAGRGLSVDLLILDELRAQYDASAWAALSKTTSARPNGLIVAISNAGSDRSVVLNALRASALEGGEESLGLFEWSAPEGCDLDDRQAWAAANPSLGRSLQESSIRTSLATDPPAVFRTEVLCQHVVDLDVAFDMAAWRACADPSGTLADLRERAVFALDAAPDGRHVALWQAVPLDDGRVRIAAAGAWSSTDEARSALPDLLAKIRPRALGWFPSGPAAVLGADLRALHGTPKSPLGQWNVTQTEMLPHAPGLVDITGADVAGACMTFVDLVAARQIIHSDDPLLNAHVQGAVPINALGDGFRFARRGVGHVNAVYAAAGAVHLARSLPLPTAVERPRIF